jgi:hypothetical protein
VRAAAQVEGLVREDIGDVERQPQGVFDFADIAGRMRRRSAA